MASRSPTSGTAESCGAVERGVGREHQVVPAAGDDAGRRRDQHRVSPRTPRASTAWRAHLARRGAALRARRRRAGAVVAEINASTSSGDGAPGRARCRGELDRRQQVRRDRLACALPTQRATSRSVRQRRRGAMMPITIAPTSTSAATSPPIPSTANAVARDCAEKHSRAPAARARRRRARRARTAPHARPRARYRTRRTRPRKPGIARRCSRRNGHDLACVRAAS